MSKIINSIDILTDGGINPETDIYEEKLYQLNFIDNTDLELVHLHVNNWSFLSA